MDLAHTLMLRDQPDDAAAAAELLTIATRAGERARLRTGGELGPTIEVTTRTLHAGRLFTLRPQIVSERVATHQLQLTTCPIVLPFTTGPSDGSKYVIAMDVGVLNSGCPKKA